MKMSFAHAFALVGKRLVRGVVDSNTNTFVTLTGTLVPVDPTQAVFFTVSSVHHALDRMPSSMLTSGQRLSPPLELLVAPYTNHFFKARTLAEQIFHMAGSDNASKANALLEGVVAAYMDEYVAAATAGVAQAA